ncbi:hypothetical protein AVEN_225792-1 [Araneus ventricosus]|uniref:Uncharacterized protein n=1 Tax=Araneus ventricosus TaxID=182803 RepID=A0A4Y2BD68_ARAVE|nr:hypothetical protein AVEN_225792-1 [Araneus ventricosus]
MVPENARTMKRDQKRNHHQSIVLVGCTDENIVARISVSKHIEHPPFLVINNLLLVISFNERIPENMRTMAMKRGQKRYHHQPIVLLIKLSSGCT